METTPQSQDQLQLGVEGEKKTAKLYYRIQNQDIKFIVMNPESKHLESMRKLVLFLKKQLPTDWPEIVFKGTVREFRDQISYSETSPNEPIHFYLHQIKTPPNQNITQDFFIGRGISVTQILENAGLDKFIAKIQSTEFKCNHNALKSTYVKSCKKNNAYKKVFIGNVLREAFGLKEKRLLVEEGSIIVTPFRRLIVDHIIMDMKNERIFFVSSQMEDINEATLRNFDQMRAYGLSKDPPPFNCIYGVASNALQWRFGCYILPEKNKPVSQDSFLVSRVFELEMEDDDIPSVESMYHVIFALRTFIIGDAEMDKILGK